MTNDIIIAIAPILVSAAVAVLTALIGLFGSAAVKFINAKKAEVVAKTGATTYNSDLSIAREVWGIVDEHFRISANLTKTFSAAADMFETEILKIIPGLTTDEIDHLRQAVAGEVNAGKAAVIADAIAEPVPDIPDTVMPVVDTAVQDAAAQEAAAEAAQAMADAAAVKLAKLKAAAADLEVMVTDDMDAAAIQAAITAAVAA